MKRSWIGFALLLILLLAGLLATRFMVRIHDPIEGKLQQAAQCAMEDDWHRAGEFFRQAEEEWEAWSHLRSCFADHNPTEEIDAEFAALKVCCARQDAVTFAAGCRSLARQVAAVGEAHELVWWNLL